MFGRLAVEDHQIEGERVPQENPNTDEELEFESEQNDAKFYQTKQWEDLTEEQQSMSSREQRFFGQINEPVSQTETESEMEEAKQSESRVDLMDESSSTDLVKEFCLTKKEGQ